MPYLLLAPPILVWVGLDLVLAFAGYNIPTPFSWVPVPVGVAMLVLGLMGMIRDPEEQACHDNLAGTYVVTRPRKSPL